MATATVNGRRQALAEFARERGDAARGRRRAAVAALVALLLLLVALAVLWAGGLIMEPAPVRDLRALVDRQIAELGRVARNEAPLSFEPSGIRPLLEQMRTMPPAYRDQARRELGRLFDAREGAEAASYFAMPPERRRAELDRRIKAEEERREAREAERTRGRDQAGRGGDGPRGETGRRPGGGPPRGGPGGGPPGGGRGRGGTEESRNERMKERIDRSSPDERARRVEYRRAVEERRRQLGLPEGRRG